MENDKLFFLGIKALIENNSGAILLLSNGPNRNPLVQDPYWDIPGGRAQQGQKAEEVLRREVKEETGIEVLKNVKFFTAVISNHELLFENRRVGLVLMVYKATVDENVKIIISNESIGYEWVDKNEAAKRLTNKYPEEFIELL